MYYSNQRLRQNKPKLTITNTKPYVPVVTVSAQGNEKLFQQLKEVLKEQLIGININQIEHHRHKPNI